MDIVNNCFSRYIFGAKDVALLVFNIWSLYFILCVDVGFVAMILFPVNRLALVYKTVSGSHFGFMN